MWDHIITIHITLPIPSHRVPLNFMLVFKSLHLNLFRIAFFRTLRFIIGGHPTGPRTIWTISVLRLSKSTLTEKIILVPTFCSLLKITFLVLSINALVVSPLIYYYECLIKGSLRVYQWIHLTLENTDLSIFWLNQPKLLEVPLWMSQSLLHVSCFKWILYFSMLK